MKLGIGFFIMSVVLVGLALWGITINKTTADNVTSIVMILAFGSVVSSAFSILCFRGGL